MINEHLTKSVGKSRRQAAGNKPKVARNWRISDELWRKLLPILTQLDPPFRGHRQRIDQRTALDGVIHQMRTGCRWSALPRRYGDDSTIHRTRQRWLQSGVLARIWPMICANCPDLAQVPPPVGARTHVRPAPRRRSAAA